MKKAKVAVLKTKPDSVIEDHIKLGRMAGISESLEKGKTTILKDNISWHFPFPGANTTPWQLEGCIRALQDEGYADLVDVHNDTVVTDPYKGEKLNKYDVVYKKYDIPVKYNFKKEDIRWERYEPEGEMIALKEIYPKGIYIPEFFRDKNIVHLPTVKSHIYTTMTGAMKNAFGGLLNTRRHYTHSVIHETLVDLLTIQKEIHSGLFCFMDGTTAASGPGPRTMTPVQKDVIMASGDMVAIDAVSAKIMGFDPMEIKCIRLAHDRGLGIGNFDEIEIVGEDVSDWNFNFTVGDNMPSLVGDLLWYSPLKVLQKLFFHTPLVYIFVFASFFYHDYLWYPIKGRQIVNDWLKTEWGQLFERY
ncbi:MAG: DUF362 domain-containing protein [candidate division Zixibacteria bacterium]|nr:DUF362 domain-containing protein [candidate division Zixibacteria bacterium]